MRLSKLEDAIIYNQQENLLQLLHYYKQGDNYIGEVSDGVHRILAIFINRAKKLLGLNEIVNLTLFKTLSLSATKNPRNQNSYILSISDFEVFDSEVEYVIGFPVDFVISEKLAEIQQQTGIQEQYKSPPRSSQPSGKSSLSKIFYERTPSVSKQELDLLLKNRQQTEARRHQTPEKALVRQYQKQQIQNIVLQDVILNQQGKSTLRIQPGYIDEQDEYNKEYISLNRLTPLMSNDWKICCYVLFKSDEVLFSNIKGQGKLFNLTLSDKNGDLIEAVFFNAACDKFHDYIKQGKWYTFQQGTLRPDDIKLNEKIKYKIIFEITARIQQVSNVLNSKQIVLPITKINNIINLTDNTFVNSLVAVVRKGGLEEIQCRDNLAKRRILEVIDDTQTKIEVTLWGDKAMLQDVEEKSILFLYKFKVGTYLDFRKLQSFRVSNIIVEPEETMFPEVKHLRQFIETFEFDNIKQTDIYDNDGFLSQLEYCTSSDLPTLELSSKHKKPRIIHGTLLHIKQDGDLYYKCCPDCNKKISQIIENSFYCEMCQKEFYSCNTKYLLQAKFCDTNGDFWATLFDEAGQQIFKIPAKELLEKLTSQPESFRQIVNNVLYQENAYIINSKLRTFDNEGRIEHTIHRVRPINYQTYNNRILENIQQ